MGHEIKEEEFLARIKAAREAKGLSQTEMAAILGVPQGTYHKYECRTLMPHKLLAKFCFHVGVTVNDIYYGTAAAGVALRAAKTKKRSAA